MAKADTSIFSLFFSNQVKRSKKGVVTPKQEGKKRVMTWSRRPLDGIIMERKHLMNALSWNIGRAALVASLLVGCGSVKNTPPGTSAVSYNACPRPDWVDNVSCEGTLCAVGIGKSMDYGFAREKAEADGQNKLAKMLQVEVRNLFEQLKQENRDFVNPDDTAGFEFTDSVTQQLTRATLSGARPAHYYNDCVQGSVYAMMTLMPERVAANLKAAVNDAAQRSMALNKARKEQAVERMNALIDQREAQDFAAQGAGMLK